MSVSLRFRLLFGAIAVVGVAIAGSNARAQDGVMNVAATVAAACEVVADPTLDFGLYDPSSDSEQVTTFQVDCTAGADVDVVLDAGLQPNGTTRNLAHESDDSEHLGYLLYQDGFDVINWDPDLAKSISVDGETPTEVQVFGRIPFGQNVASGSYSDTVGITLNVN